MFQSATDPRLVRLAEVADWRLGEWPGMWVVMDDDGGEMVWLGGKSTLNTPPWGLGALGSNHLSYRLAKPRGKGRGMQ